MFNERLKNEHRLVNRFCEHTAYLNIMFNDWLKNEHRL